MSLLAISSQKSRCRGWPRTRKTLGRTAFLAALEATQGQMDIFLSQLAQKCHLEEVASV